MSDPTVEGAEQETPKRRLPDLLWPALAFVYLTCFFAAAHFVPDGPRERDGYYHARVSQTLVERGFSRHFPWTQQSTWKDGYCDKELLYHVLMAPFTMLASEAIRGAQVFTLLASLAVFLALFLILRHQRVPAPTFFVMLLASMGGGFLVRLTMVRSHVLSISLALLGLHLLMQRRHRALFVLGFVYAWSYTVPLVLVLLAAPFVFGRYLAGDRFDWRSLLGATLGVAAGLLIHPYSPLTLENLLTIVQIVATGAKDNASLFELGHEIYSYPTRVFLMLYPLLMLSLLGLTLWGFLRQKKLQSETIALLCVLLSWFVMSLVFSRFTEYAAPVMALTLGLVMRDTLPDFSFSFFWRQRAMQKLAAAAALALLLALHLQAAGYYLREAAPGKAPRFRQAALWIEKNIPAKEQLLNLYWDEFPELYYDVPSHHFTWGIDPMFTRRYQPKVATLLEKTRRGLIPFDSKKIAAAVGARFLIISHERELGQRPRMLAGGAKRRYVDRHAAIYQLR